MWPKPGPGDDEPGGAKLGDECAERCERGVSVRRDRVEAQHLPPPPPHRDPNSALVRMFRPTY